MLHAYGREETAGLYHWASNGGDQTIASYEQANGKKDHWREAIDIEHVKWLHTLPTIHRDETRGLVFVHGGIDPKTFPECSDEIRMWTRSDKFFKSERWPDRAELKDILVVHGHTPTRDFEPDQQRRRINVDTGRLFRRAAYVCGARTGSSATFSARALTANTRRNATSNTAPRRDRTEWKTSQRPQRHRVRRHPRQRLRHKLHPIPRRSKACRAHRKQREIVEIEIRRYQQRRRAERRRLRLPIALRNTMALAIRPNTTLIPCTTHACGMVKPIERMLPNKLAYVCFATCTPKIRSADGPRLWMKRM